MGIAKTNTKMNDQSLQEAIDRLAQKRKSMLKNETIKQGKKLIVFIMSLQEWWLKTSGRSLEYDIETILANRYDDPEVLSVLLEYCDEVKDLDVSRAVVGFQCVTTNKPDDLCVSVVVEFDRIKKKQTPFNDDTKA